MCRTNCRLLQSSFGAGACLRNGWQVWNGSGRSSSVPRTRGSRPVSTLPFVFKIVLVLVVTGAAGYDCKYRKIPNWLNLSGLILGFGLNTLFGGTSGFVSAGQGFLLALAIYLPLYLIKGMGAGDVKLMGAIGSLVGPSNWFQIFVATALFGGLAAAMLALTKKRFGETCWN